MGDSDGGGVKASRSRTALSFVGWEAEDYLVRMILYIERTGQSISTPPLSGWPLDFVAWKYRATRC